MITINKFSPTWLALNHLFLENCIDFTSKTTVYIISNNHYIVENNNFLYLHLLFCTIIKHFILAILIKRELPVHLPAGLQPWHCFIYHFDSSSNGTVQRTCIKTIKTISMIQICVTYLKKKQTNCFLSLQNNDFFMFRLVACWYPAVTYLESNRVKISYISQFLVKFNILIPYLWHQRHNKAILIFLFRNIALP